MKRHYQVITPVEVTDPGQLYMSARTTMLERSSHVVDGIEEKFVPDEDTIAEIIGSYSEPKIEGCIGVLLAYDNYVTPGCEISETIIVPAGLRVVK
jgi:hypothetical protein